MAVPQEKEYPKRAGQAPPLQRRGRRAGVIWTTSWGIRCGLGWLVGEAGCRRRAWSRFGGVEAGGQEVDGDLQGVFGDGGGVGVVAREGVPVSYEVETFVIEIGLELDPVLEGAETVADVETSGGAHAGDDSIRGSGQVLPQWN